MLYKPASNTPVALVPGLPRFYLPFEFTIIHGSGRLAKKKTGEGLGALDVGGEGGPTAKTTHRTICLSTLPRLRTPDLSVLETTRLDQ